MAYLGSVIASQVMEWFGLMFCFFFADYGIYGYESTVILMEVDSSYDFFEFFDVIEKLLIMNVILKAH